MFTSTSSPLHARNGGLIGLAATAIALGQDFSKWLTSVIPRVLGCFGDAESRVRYYACESLYNIAKVCKGEILVHFNGIFDALSRLSADSEASVKNGAELLDRLLKDIVAETALTYVSKYPENVDRTFSDWDADQWHDRRHHHHHHHHHYRHAGRGTDAEPARSHPLEDSPPTAALDITRSYRTQDPSSFSRASTLMTGSSSVGSIPTGQTSHHEPLSPPGPADAAATFARQDDGRTRDPSPHTASHQRILSTHSVVPPTTAGLVGTDRGKPASPAFSLHKFIPLLSERIYVISPFTRSHLVSWITILDSIPDLELVSYLPDFLDGLL